MPGAPSALSCSILMKLGSCVEVSMDTVGVRRIVFVGPVSNLRGLLVASG